MTTEYNALNGQPYNPETHIFISDAFGNAIPIKANSIEAWMLWVKRIEYIRSQWPNGVVRHGRRLGQELFNKLFDFNRNDLAILVTGTVLDPFNQDNSIDDFLEFIDANWER